MGFGSKTAWLQNPCSWHHILLGDGQVAHRKADSGAGQGWLGGRGRGGGPASYFCSENRALELEGAQRHPLTSNPGLDPGEGQPVALKGH